MEIKQYFQKVGCSVFDASRVGGGFPDLVLGYRGHTLLCEVKDPEKDKLKQTQVKFIDNWRGQIAIVSSIEEATELLRVFNAKYSNKTT